MLLIIIKLFNAQRVLLGTFGQNFESNTRKIIEKDSYEHSVSIYDMSLS